MQAIQQAAPSADHKIKVRFGLYMSSLRLLEDRSVEFPFNLNTFINNVASWEALVSAVRAETSASVIWSLVRYAVEKIDFARLGSIALAELKQLSLIATSAGLVYYKFPNAGIYVSLAFAAEILILASRAIPLGAQLASAIWTYVVNSSPLETLENAAISAGPIAELALTAILATYDYTADKAARFAAVAIVEPAIKVKNFFTFRELDIPEDDRLRKSEGNPLVAAEGVVKTAALIIKNLDQV
jgi:hypothetical protein